MENVIENGVICIFDILGYKNFITNNSIYECAENIKTIIAELPNDVKGKILSICKSDNSKFTQLNKTIDEYFNKKLRCIIVSDTILLIFDFSALDNDDTDFFRFVSLAYIQEFQNISFKKGFPMRGCVDIGEFYYYDNIFAGNTIVNSFQELEYINFSGVIITDNALNILKKKNVEYTNQFINRYIHKYIVPMKDDSEIYKNIIEWQIDFKKDEDFDLQQKLFESFHAHKKEVNLSAMKKINNTEKIYRYFLMRKKYK